MWTPGRLFSRERAVDEEESAIRVPRSAWEWAIQTGARRCLLGNGFPVMNLFPLISRELQVASRRPVTFRMRMFYGGGAMVFSYWLVLVWSGAIIPGGLGLFIFTALSALGAVSALFAGFLLAADALSQERRDGTLALLFLTNLRPLEIVLGKACGKALVPFYAFLAMFPCLGISLLLGGISNSQFWRMQLVLVNLLFFSTAIGLWVSSFCVRARTAYLGSLALLLVTLFAAPVLASALGAGTIIDHPLAFFSPLAGFLFALGQSAASGNGAGLFWLNSLLTLAIAWLAILSAASRIRRNWQDETQVDAALDPAGPAVGGNRVRIAERSAKFSLKKKLAPQPPMAIWFRTDSWVNRCLLWFPVLLAIWLWFGVVGGSVRGEVQWLILLVGIHHLMRAALVIFACQSIQEIRHSGALELLLVTPVSVSQIIQGMYRAHTVQKHFPLVLVGVIELATLVMMVPRNVTIFLAMANFLLLLFDVYCIFWIGLWQGLRHARIGYAIFGSWLRVLSASLLWLAFQFLPGNVINSVGLLASGLVVGFFNSLFFLQAARDAVEEHFRLFAAVPFGQKPPPIENRWSAMNWDGEWTPQPADDRTT
jgi:ABC-type transport system involved in multi-copper enzyme maturation permease subunit